LFNSALLGRFLLLSLNSSDLITMDETAIIHFDGAVPNPGKAAAACIIQLAGQTHTFSRYLGEPISNNVAEYHRLLLEVEEALKIDVKQAKIYGDSELVVKHLNGIYKVRKPHLQPLYEEARSHLSKFVKYELIWIRRSDNALADAAVGECIGRAGN
ncbi:MAG: ribonuclease HI family protein, partial [Nostoc sp. DedQUE04]|uniref:ribonuclease HI family protein n=1 Tax=Nostoc sp. DedQUE04 TaxID=3075390 RepID=UPI002AD42AC5